jgi:hypothetical protein
MVNSVTLFYNANPSTAITLILAPIIIQDMGLTIVCILLLAFALYIYRYIPCNVDIEDNYIVSPVDGDIIEIIKTPTYLFISINVHITNKHYITYPCNGKVVSNSDVLHQCNILMNNYSLVQVTYNGKPSMLIGNVKATDYLSSLNLVSNVTLLFPIRSPDGLSKFQLHNNIFKGKKININKPLGVYNIIV